MVRRLLCGIGAVCLLSWAALPSSAINIAVDYTYDTNNFFSPGSQARATIEAVADYYSDILDDTFAAVSAPAPFTSSLPPAQNPGTVEWEWTMLFDNPSANSEVTITNPTLNANQYRLFVGAKNLSGSTLGQGGPGGRGWANFSDGGFFTSNEITQINAITNEFKSAVETRGEASGFSAWGGSVSFDNDAGTNWHFNHTTAPTAGKSDLLSVAIHEIGHVLGLGSSDEWNALTAGSGNSAFYFGSDAVTEYGGNVPLAFNTVGATHFADKAHWREGTMSTVFGSAAPQEAAMDPSVTTGTRKRLTALDAAALSDIGWTVVAPPGLPGDFNGNNIVDAADYAVWRNRLGGIYNMAHYTLWKTNFGQSAGTGAGGSAAVPEPATSTLAFATSFLALSFLPRSISWCKPSRLLS